jgi:hypothetical protein
VRCESFNEGNSNWRGGFPAAGPDSFSKRLYAAFRRPIGTQSRARRPAPHQGNGRASRWLQHGDRLPALVVKAIPFRAHLALDALGALALAATPFVTGHWKGTGQWVPHLALALFELSSLAMTDPVGKGNLHGDVEAVPRANTEDPRRKIYEGPPAVTSAPAG